MVESIQAVNLQHIFHYMHYIQGRSQGLAGEEPRIKKIIFKNLEAMHFPRGSGEYAPQEFF